DRAEGVTDQHMRWTDREQPPAVGGEPDPCRAVSRQRAAARREVDVRRTRQGHRGQNPRSRGHEGRRGPTLFDGRAGHVHACPGYAVLLSARRPPCEGDDAPGQQRKTGRDQGGRTTQHGQGQRRPGDRGRAEERRGGPQAQRQIPASDGARRRSGGNARAPTSTGACTAAGTGTCEGTASTTPAPVAFCSHSSGLTVTRWSRAGCARGLTSSATTYGRPRITARARAHVMRARVPRGEGPTKEC